MTFPLAMLTMVLAWVQLAVVLTGLGLAASRLLGVRAVSGRGLIVNFWLGLAVSLLWVQLWHLVAPVGIATLVGLSLVGAAGLLWNWRELWRLLRTRVVNDWWLGLVVLAIALWLANLALGEVTNYDTGLYHLQAVKWAASFPLVTGLANLHSRFGFNSSFFVWAAMFGAGTRTTHVFGVATGFFYCALFAQTVIALRALSREPATGRSHWLFLGLMLAPTVAELFGRSVASLAPEGPIYVVTVVLAALLLRDLEESPVAEVERDRDLIALLLVAAAGCTIKLSFLVFGATAGLIAIGHWLMRRRTSRRSALARLGLLVAPAAATILVWMLRGVLLSGYPLFPSRIGALNVSWRVPEVFAIEDLQWVKSWARYPDIHWSEAIGPDAIWLPHWLQFMPPELVLPLQIAFIGLLVALLAGQGVTTRVDHLRRWLFLLPAALSALAWFALAPDYRFASGMFWTLAAGSLVVLCGALGPLLGRAQVALEIILCVVLFVGISPFKRPLFVAARQIDEPFFSIPAGSLRQAPINHDVSINVPTTTDQCWDAPLPCAPTLRGQVQLRSSEGIGHGFMVVPIPGRPPGIAAVPGLVTPDAIGAWFVRSHLLRPGSWAEFDRGSQTIAFNGRAKIAIYSANRARVSMQLTAARLERDSAPVEACPLRITLADGTRGDVQLSVDQPSTFSLRLAADINIVTLELPRDKDNVRLRPIVIGYE